MGVDANNRFDFLRQSPDEIKAAVTVLKAKTQECFARIAFQVEPPRPTI
jgi:hypothetical protein